MADEEITDEEKLNIAQHYLLTSPPCQFNEVLEDVKKLVPAELLSQSYLAGVSRTHHSKGAVVDAPSGSKAIVCAAGEVDPTHYVDSKTNSVFQYNHLTNETSEDSAQCPVDESLELKRAAIQSSLETYVKTYYSSIDSAAGVFAKDGKIEIVLVGEKKNLRNFWSGKLTSSWTIDASMNMTGSLKIHAHYFEDGNVQLQSSRSFPASSVSGGSEAEVAAAVEKVIKESESSVQTGLGEMYLNMNEETFKSMRRTMPITRTKMEWNVNAVRMVRQVQKAK